MSMLLNKAACRPKTERTQTIDGRFLTGSYPKYCLKLVFLDKKVPRKQ